MSVVSRFARRRAAALASCALAVMLPAIGEAQTTSGPVLPMYGNIAPFYGNIAPFYGNIAPFYGNIAPFYGNIAPFYGNIAPFWGGTNPFTPAIDAKTIATYGSNYDTFWGTGSSNPYRQSIPGITYSQISGFWATNSASFATLQATWAKATSDADYANVAALLKTTILDPAQQFWGKAINSTYDSRSTVMSVYTGDLLAQAGITANADGSINVASLRGVSLTQQAMLYLRFYDNLMSLAGTGHVDWWMGATGWSPALALTQGTTPKGGTAPTVGMLDFALQSGKSLPKQLVQFGSGVSDGHGAAVGSLIMGSVDGSGIMGVVPAGSVNVVVYNPYDETGTTNWTDVGTGLAKLSATIFPTSKAPVGVLNASLGVPGWTLHPGWNDALANANAKGHDLVIAAGNEGVTQTQNVPWNFAVNPTLLIVGSVGVDNTISNFSNRPGEACLLPTGSSSSICTEANKLKYRFVVAPGELILVSDGQGGFSRQSGTSLAAPLVSGTIALLQNRWPWLANYPDETAQIILKSATPLGTQPGADPVYGAGMLNIKAAQSPLDWSNVRIYQSYNGKVSVVPTSVSAAMTQVRQGTQSLFDSTGLAFTVFESVGATYRDFVIPLSSRLVGQTVSTSGGQQLYQSYLVPQLRAQAGFARQATADYGQPARFGMASMGVPAGEMIGMGLRVSVAPRQVQAGFRSGQNRFQSEAALVGEKSGFRFGFGGGANALDGRAGFGFQSDYSLDQGGANPLLGLASGGGYLAGEVAVTPRLTASFGSTQRNDRRDLALFGLAIGPQSDSVRRYRAEAQHVGLSYLVGNRLTLHSSLTLLRERAAVLGVQSIDAADLRGGSRTSGVAFGFDLALPQGLMLTGSTTVGRTRLGGAQIQTDPGGLISTAAELAIAKSHVFASSDRIRFALSKPLHVEAGTLKYVSVQVIDRQTGELGVIGQSFAPTSGRQPVIAEMLYGRAFGAGQISLFGRAQANGARLAGTAAYAGGVQIGVAF